MRLSVVPFGIALHFSSCHKNDCCFDIATGSACNIAKPGKTAQSTFQVNLIEIMGVSGGPRGGQRGQWHPPFIEPEHAGLGFMVAETTGTKNLCTGNRPSRATVEIIIMCIVTSTILLPKMETYATSCEGTI